MELKRSDAVTVAQLDVFDEVIDVRSPAEFALDHVPQAVNCPVLDGAERAQVGTLYTQVSPFDAKKIGAALVSKNIARHIEERFRGRDRGWRPLVYCWRGGQRSAAMAHVLRQVGWDAATLAGGYRAYRREVMAQLDETPRRFRFQVVSGATGSGKSRLLAALAAQRAQKMFDSLVWSALKRLDSARPVFVEAESKKIGQLQVPAQLLDRMRKGECLRLEVPLPERVRFLVEEYRHFLEDPAALKEKLKCLTSRYGHAVIDRWIAQTDSGAWRELVADLLVTHYDPSYLRAAAQNYLHYDEARCLPLERLDQAEVARAATELLKTEP